MSWFGRVWNGIKSIFERPNAQIIQMPQSDAPIGPITSELGSVAYYQELWSKASLNQDNDELDMVQEAISKIKENIDRYKLVQSRSNIPWELIAGFHGLEASFDFDTCLHNGDPLPGPTTHVPKGRGPFDSWEDGASDALKEIDRPDKWTIAECLKAAERYNGTGYLKYHQDIKSPYVWACTNIYAGHGKYVGDGSFDETALTDQVGVAAIFLTLKQQGLLEVPEV